MSEHSKSIPGTAERGDWPPLSGSQGKSQHSSILVEQTTTMEYQRRLQEQEGHRRHLHVSVKEAKEPVVESHGAEGELQNSILQHPLLDRQIYDGIDPNVNPEPPLSTDARREFDNAQRDQSMEKQLRLQNELQNQPRFSNAPRPKGP